MESTDAIYPSKVDAWLATTILGGLLGIIGLAVYLFFFHIWAGVFVLICALVSGLIIYACGVPCRYTLKQDHLHIQAGLVQDTVPYGQIIGATHTRNPLSAPALSLDRIKIELKGAGFPNYRLISPVKRDEFIAELLRRVEGHQSLAD